MDTRKIIRLNVVESTNQEALDLGRKQGEASGTVVVAGSQTGGRGRLNRTWISPPETGLYFSLILRPDLAREHLPRVTLAAGLALCKAIETEYSVSPEIKWPNDLWLEGKKFGGILTETGPSQKIPEEQHLLVVVGVGLNLMPPDEQFPPDVAERCTYLSLHAYNKIDVESLMLSSVVSIEKEVLRLEKGYFSEILKEWSQRDAVYGKNLTWVTPQGNLVEGVALGPDDDGMLRIRDKAGAVHEVLSGDINLAAKKHSW